MIVADFGENPRSGERADPGEAGQDRDVGMLRESFGGCLGQMIDRSAGGIELHDQRSGLFTEGGFHPRSLTQLFGGEDGVEPVDPGVDVALSARFEQ